MLKQGPDFHFEISVIRNKRVRDNEVMCQKILALAHVLAEVLYITITRLFKYTENFTTKN